MLPPLDPEELIDELLEEIKETIELLRKAERNVGRMKRLAEKTLKTLREEHEEL